MCFSCASNSSPHDSCVYQLPDLQSFRCDLPCNECNYLVNTVGSPLIRYNDRTRLVIKTFEKDSRPRPRSPGLETKNKTLGNRSRDQDQDLGQQVSRPRPRPWSPGLETKTKALVIRSRDQDPIFHQTFNGHSCKLRT